MVQLARIGRGMGPRGGAGGAVSQLATWVASRNQFQAGTASADANVCCWGDSITGGAFSDNSTAAGIWTNAYPTVLAADLAAAGLPANNSQSFFGDNNVPSVGSISTRDPRLVLNSGWTSSATVNCPAAHIIHNSTTVNAFAFTPTINVDKVECITATNTGLGTGTIQFDAGSTTAVNNNITPRNLVTTASATLGAHTLNYKRVGGDNYVTGMICQNSTVKNIRVHNFGWYGGTSVDQTSGSNPWSPVNFISFMTPILTLIEVGVNDMVSAVPLATTQTNMQTMITAAKLTGSVVILSCTPIATGTISQATQDAMYAMQTALATTNNVPFFDIIALFGGSNAAAIANGYMSVGSGSHPIQAGYAAIASGLSTLLMAA